MTKTLLIVHHTPSPHTHEMFEAVVSGATDPEIEGVEVVRRPALTVSPVEMLEADGYLLGTPANLGYMSGALKHAFDQSLLPAARLHPWPTVRRLPPRQRGHRGSRARHRRHHRRARLGAGCGDGCGDGQADQGRRRGVLESRRDRRRAADGRVSPLTSRQAAPGEFVAPLMSFHGSSSARHRARGTAERTRHSAWH